MQILLNDYYCLHLAKDMLVILTQKIGFMEDIPFNVQMHYVCHKGRGYALIYHKAGV